MSVADGLRQYAQFDDEEADRMQREIEGLEKRLVELRDKRDDLRFRAAESKAAAHFLDYTGHKVERVGREVRVSVDPRFGEPVDTERSEK